MIHRTTEMVANIAVRSPSRKALIMIQTATEPIQSSSTILSRHTGISVENVKRGRSLLDTIIRRNAHVTSKWIFPTVYPGLDMVVDVKNVAQNRIRRARTTIGTVVDSRPLLLIIPTLRITLGVKSVKLEDIQLVHTIVWTARGILFDYLLSTESTAR